MRLVVVLVLLPLLALSAGCGFQLRGAAELPASMERTRITGGGPTGDLVRELRVLLEGAGVAVVDAGETARLQLIEDRIQRSVQSIGASARVREFALEHVVRFRLVAADGTERVPEQRLTLYRDYRFDQDQVLGTTSEEELLRRELNRDMSREIVRRLESAVSP